MQQGFSVNRKPPVVTYALAAVNVAAFLADLLTKSLLGYQWLSVMGAKVNEWIIQYGEWWRFATPMFLHGSVEHIVFNTVALIIWGRHLEALLGRARYLILYLCAGVLGCAASFAFSNAVSVGASGAIFGLFGALLYLRRQNRGLFDRVFGAQVLIIIGINIVYGFLPGKNIDNYGHLGGLLGGFLMCGATGFYGQGRPGKRAMFVCMFAACAAVLIAIGYALA